MSLSVIVFKHQQGLDIKCHSEIFAPVKLKSLNGYMYALALLGCFELAQDFW